MTKTISAIIICTNEESTVALSVKSIYEYIDEIIIVDNASTDNSSFIIESFSHLSNIVFIKLDSRVQISVARQIALNHVNTDWVFKFDADFVAYENNNTDLVTDLDIDIPGQYQSIEKLISIVKQINQNNIYDAIYLYTINLYGDLNHIKPTFKVSNLILAKKSHLKFTHDDKFADIIQLSSNPKTNVLYMNDPKSYPFFFVHLQGVLKSNQYLLYQLFKNEYQIYCNNNNHSQYDTPFESWYEMKTNNKYINGLNYVSRMSLTNVIKHDYDLPNQIHINKSSYNQNFATHVTDYINIKPKSFITNNYIIIQPDIYGGLCNRLRFIVSGIYIARANNLNLYIDWIPSYTCTCKLDDLFNVNDSGLLFDNVYDNKICKKEFVNKYNVRENDHSVNSKQIEHQTLFYSGYNYLKINGKYINEYHETIELKNVIKNNIKDIINIFTNNNKYAISIHIRRTDNNDSIKISTDDKFIKYIDHIIKKLKYNGLIYLASDDLNTINKFKSIFNNIITYDIPTFDRTNTNAIINALIDLNLLSNSDYLMGSFGSSFSSFASSLNPKCKLITIS
jgi:glycosyltransferase involved in cell wall biosynthesis